MVDGVSGLIKRAAGIVILGNSYGPPPTYGELIYQYRQSLSGWKAGFFFAIINIHSKGNIKNAGKKKR